LGFVGRVFTRVALWQCFLSFGDQYIGLEQRIDLAIVEALGKLGHRIAVVDSYDRELFGGGKFIAETLKPVCRARARNRE
jgi:hypothetical protein